MSNYNIIQEAVTFTMGVNFQPIPRKLRLPETSSGTTIYLLSSSYEYDINMIKETPIPKIKYKHLLIPQRVIDRLGPRVFRFFRTQTDHQEKVRYVLTQKLQPTLIPLKPPYEKFVEENLYVPMSEFVNQVNSHFNMMPLPYIKENIFKLFQWTFDHFNPKANKRVIVIDTNRFPLNTALSIADYQSGLINALLTAYIYQPIDKIPSIPMTLLFRHDFADYKFDLSNFNKNEVNKLKLMLKKIGTVSSIEADASASDFDNEDSSSSFEDVVGDEKDNTEIDALVKQSEKSKSDDENTLPEEPEKDITGMTKTGITATMNSIAAKFGKTKSELNDNIPDSDSKDMQYDSIVLKKQAKLSNGVNKTINLDVNIKDLKTVSTDIMPVGDNPVEKEIVKDAVKETLDERKVTDTADTLKSNTSARELAIRNKVGQIKLGNVDFKTLTSITDLPAPERVTPRRLTTTNTGSLKGTGFAKIGEAYEKNLLQRDIVSTFMNLSTLPDGFYVTNVEVTDVSTSVSMMDNWRVTLKNKVTGKSNVINIRIPKLKNSRFYMDGMWWNIGKQDFPIPILKVNNKEVIITSNYNKMAVNRYETKSLVTISALIKVLNELEKNPYVKPGSSIKTNVGFVSTIEYDEFAKRWFSFKNKDFELYFNRAFCLKQYNFVNVSTNEFCCGMNNKVPIVINTDTGLTRNGETLTDIIVSTLPDELKMRYNKNKPGKLSMYTNVRIMGIEIPVGVAIAAWEGLSKLIAKANADVQYVKSSFKDPKYMTIIFKDKTLAIPNTILNQLLFNGFYRINTRAFNASDFEVPILSQDSVYIDIFNNNFFRNYQQLTMFITNYQFFVDAITKDVCHHYNIPDDICGMLVYASQLLCDNNFSGENNASLYRIRSSEIIPAIIHDRLAHAISNYNNKVGSRHKSTTFSFDPRCVITELRGITTVQPCSALNPIIELHSQENISRQGFHGVNNDRAYTLDKRTYDKSMVGKMAISTPNNASVGISRQLVASPKITSLRGYTSNKTIDDKFDDLELASFSELVTPGTVSRDDSIRTSIATSQSGHITPTLDSQPVLISNGIDELIPGYMSEEFSVMAEDDGTVIDMNEDYMIIQYKSGVKKAVNIGLKSGFNVGGGTYTNNQLKANFELNNKFKKNDILAYHPLHFSKDSTGMIRLNIGPMMNVAFSGLYSTYEDAGLNTVAASKRLAVDIIMKQSAKIAAEDDIDQLVKIGDEVEIGSPLVVFGLGDTGDKSVDKLLSAFGGKTNNILDSAKRVIKSQHAGTIIDIRMHTTCNLDSLSPSLFKIVSEHFNQNVKRRKILDKYDKSETPYKLETLYTHSTQPIKGSSIKGITTDVLIEIFVSHKDEASVGDKLTIFGAAKQILSEVIPEGEEPYAESTPDEEISLFIAPSSNLKRMIPSLSILASGNKVLFALKDETAKIWNS